MNNCKQKDNSQKWTEKKSGSPFIDITYRHRMYLLFFFSLYIFLEIIKLCFSYDSEPKIAATAKIVELVLYILPILFYQASFGWLHPLIFPTIFIFFKYIPNFIGEWVELFLNGPSEIVYPIKLLTAAGSWSPNKLSTLVAYKSLLTSIGLISYYIGFFFIATPAIPKINFETPKNIRKKIIPIIILTFFLFFVYIYLQGGLSNYLLSWSMEGRSKAVGEYGPLLALIRMSPFLCLLWYCLESNIERKVFFWGLTFASLIIDFLTSGSRSVIIMILALYLLIWMIRNRKIPSKRITFYIVFCILLIGLLGNFRRDLTHNGNLDWSHLIKIQDAVDASLGSSEEEGEFQKRSTQTDGALPILSLVPSRYDFLYGQSYLTIFTSLIPRQIWPDKPPTIGPLVAAKFFNLPNGGIPPGGIAEAYWNFHIPGIILVFSLFGAFHKWLAKFFRTYHDKPAALIIYLVLLWRLLPDSLSINKTIFIVIPLLSIICFIGAIRLRFIRNQHI